MTYLTVTLAIGATAVGYMVLYLAYLGAVKVVDKLDSRSRGLVR